MSKYTDYINLFLFYLEIKLLQNTGINKYIIELEKDKLLLYRPIYSLCFVKLENLKIYIKTYIKTGFIWTFKFFVDAIIFFDKKPDKSL